jgi:hypothetical protein
VRSPTDPGARLRGTCVGAASGAVSVGAHALGGGPVSLTSSAVVLLVAACALTGTVAAAMRPGLARLLPMLAVGQAIGHVALAISPEHCHGRLLTPPMLAAHALAVPVGALLIRGTEAALRRLYGCVLRVLVALTTTVVAPQAHSARTPAPPSISPRRLLISSGIGRRGPPRWVFFETFHRPADFAVC